MERMSAHELLAISNRNKRKNVDDLKRFIYTTGLEAARCGETSVVINFDEHNVHPEMRGYMEGFARQVFPGITAFRTEVPNSMIIGSGDRLVMIWSSPV